MLKISYQQIKSLTRHESREQPGERQKNVYVCRDPLETKSARCLNASQVHSQQCGTVRWINSRSDEAGGQRNCKARATGKMRVDSSKGSSRQVENVNAMTKEKSSRTDAYSQWQVGRQSSEISVNCLSRIAPTNKVVADLLHDAIRPNPEQNNHQ